MWTQPKSKFLAYFIYQFTCIASSHLLNWKKSGNIMLYCLAGHSLTLSHGYDIILFTSFKLALSLSLSSQIILSHLLI